MVSALHAEPTGSVLIATDQGHVGRFVKGRFETDPVAGQRGAEVDLGDYD